MDVDGTKILPCKCRSQFCLKCVPGIMVKLREKLRPVVESWSSPQMLTLTVARDFAENGEVAYEECQRLRKVSELVRSLEKKGMIRKGRMFYVIEFHRDGFPHWHLLVDSVFVEYEYLKKRWGVGHVWISNNTKFKSKSHAVHYVTKYVGKIENELPDWVLDYRGNIRRFSAARGLFGITKRPKKKPSSAMCGRRKRVRKTPRDRTKVCGVNSCLFKVSAGSGKLVFQRNLNLPYWLVRDLTLEEIEMAKDNEMFPKSAIDEFLKAMWTESELLTGRYLCYHDRKVLRELEDQAILNWASTVLAG